MFTKINKLAIWQYDSAVPEAKLRRHYRVARSVICALMTSAVVTVSSFAEVVLLGGSSTFALIVLAVASAVGIALLLPGIAAIFWAMEIEKVLAVRGLAPSHAQSTERRVSIAAMKTVLWVVILLLAFHFIITPMQA